MTEWWCSQRWAGTFSSPATPGGPESSPWHVPWNTHCGREPSPFPDCFAFSTWTWMLQIPSCRCKQLWLPGWKLVPPSSWNDWNLPTKLHSLSRIRCDFLLEEVSALECKPLFQNYPRLGFILAIFENQSCLTEFLKTTHHQWVCGFDSGHSVQWLGG